MRRIKKSKLPMWLISRLPFNEEDEAIGSGIVPGVLFPFMGICLLLYKFYNPKTFWIELIISILIMVVILLISRWILYQVELLKVSREELMLIYKREKDPKKKEELRLRLENLCVFAKEPKDEEF